jgi:hypothetical protein
LRKPRFAEALDILSNRNPPLNQMPALTCMLKRENKGQ